MAVEPIPPDDPSGNGTDKPECYICKESVESPPVHRACKCIADYAQYHEACMVRHIAVTGQRYCRICTGRYSKYYRYYDWNKRSCSGKVHRVLVSCVGFIVEIIETVAWGVALGSLIATILMASGMRLWRSDIEALTWPIGTLVFMMRFLFWGVVPRSWKRMGAAFVLALALQETAAVWHYHATKTQELDYVERTAQCWRIPETNLTQEHLPVPCISHGWSVDVRFVPRLHRTMYRFHDTEKDMSKQWTKYETNWHDWQEAANLTCQWAKHQRRMHRTSWIFWSYGAKLPEVVQACHDTNYDKQRRLSMVLRERADAIWQLLVRWDLGPWKTLNSRYGSW